MKRRMVDDLSRSAETLGEMLVVDGKGVTHSWNSGAMQVDCQMPPERLVGPVEEGRTEKGCMFCTDALRREVRARRMDDERKAER